MEGFDYKKNLKERKFLIGIVGLILVILVAVVFSKFSSKNKFLADVSAAFSQTLNDVFGFKKENLLYEVDLSKENTPELPSESEKSLDLGLIEEKKSNLDTDKLALSQKSVSLKSSAPKMVEKKVQDCPFSSAGLASKKIYLNEIAWMGGKVSPNDEWMELKNSSGAEINLTGWQIKNQSEKIKVTFQSGDKISSNSFYLLERTDDDSVLNVTADKIYSGALSNEGDWLKLFDSNCNLVDELNATGDWKKFGGDNVTKKTLERDLRGEAWRTSAESGGTPRAENSQ